jgi:hypothetical protein
MRAHDLALMFYWNPECLVCAQYCATCQQVPPNDRRYRQSLVPFQADVTVRCRIRPGPKTGPPRSGEILQSARHIVNNGYNLAIDNLWDVDDGSAWSVVQQLRQWRCDSKWWREWRGSESWQSVYNTMTTLEIRFVKCVSRHSDASLNFVCRLLCFELVFSVQSSLGMIGLRYWNYLLTGVKSVSRYWFLCQMVTVSTRSSICGWLLPSKLLFSTEFCMGILVQ